jgi:hypothetical protein
MDEFQWGYIVGWIIGIFFTTLIITIVRLI